MKKFLGRRLWLEVKRRGLVDSIKDKIIGFVKSSLRNIMQGLKDFLIGLLDKIEIFRKIRETFQCLRDTVTSIVENAKRNIGGFINAIKAIMSGGWVGFIKVLVNTICNWSDFKKALLWFNDSFANSGPKRWKLIGNFVGGLVVAIGGAN